MLSREGVHMNHNKQRRLYRGAAAGSSSHWTQASRGDAGSAAASPATESALVDRLPARRTERWPTIPHPHSGDDYTRESLRLVPDPSLPDGRVIRAFEALVARRVLPWQCVSDSGSEFNGLARDAALGR
jgi:hypothetical protein